MAHGAGSSPAMHTHYTAQERFLSNWDINPPKEGSSARRVADMYGCTLRAGAGKNNSSPSLTLKLVLNQREVLQVGEGQGQAPARTSSSDKGTHS